MSKYNPEWTQHGFTRRDWLRQNGLCPECESPETIVKYESSEDGLVKECAMCGCWLGKPSGTER